MGYTDIIAREADSLPSKNKAEMIDFIKFIKEKQSSAGGASSVRTPEETEAFFRSFNVNTSGYKFDREDANVR